MVQPLSSSLQIQYCSCPRLQQRFQELSQTVKKIIKKIVDFFSNLGNFVKRTPTIIPAITGTPMPSTSNPQNAPNAPILPVGPKNLLAFYREQESNNNGITVRDILQADAAWLESNHRWIQWAFPLEKPSGANPTAPVLDAATIQAFRNDAALRNQVIQIFQTMLLFYGLTMGADGKVMRGPEFSLRRPGWLHTGSHHFLRITRIIHSLGLLLGPPNVYGKAFFDIMEDIYRNEGQSIIPIESYHLWRNAILVRYL